MSAKETPMDLPQAPLHPASWITGIIREFLEASPPNTLADPTNEPAFGAPLVGFSQGDDPLFSLYKEVVGPFHWTPEEIFTRTFPGAEVSGGDLTVISWILPQTEATKRANRKETFTPAERWARARIFGEEVNNGLRRHVVASLMGRGVRAVAPVMSPDWSRRVSDRFGFASVWSERHVAHAAGLGTFGLCDGLITPVGKAMRTGSVVAGLKIPPTPRPYTDHHAYCLFYTHGTCGKCIPRCPVGAISEKGHDKQKCFRHIRETTTPYVLATFGLQGHMCGLCQTGVPCESRIPSAKDRL